MPLHLNSITNDCNNSSLLARIIWDGIHECRSLFAAEDRKHFCIQRDLTDICSGELIGWLNYYMVNNDEKGALELLDIDIVLENPLPSKVHFLKLLEGSSDSNEYYEIEAAGEGQHLEIETVNRCAEPGDLTGTERDVFISVFPFELDVYENMSAFNERAGFSRPVRAGDTELFIGGYSERFSMPGGLFRPGKNSNEHFSFLVGTVESAQDVAVQLGEFCLSFVLAQVSTALGTVPVAMGREVFDLTALKAGCTVVMNADVKADIAGQGLFRKVS